MMLIFRNKTIADTWLQEIGVTPSGVWVWLGATVDPNADPFVELVGNPDGTPNVITYAQDATGRCAIGHPFSAEDVAWLTDYCSAPIASGDMIVSDALPGDWVAAEK